MNSGPTIKLHSTGVDVKRLQRILVMIKSLGPDQIDGIFGPKTEQAVKDFQSGNSLTVDGIVGPMTWQALPADPHTPLLQEGATGQAVTALQTGLKLYSGGDPTTDPGTIDGDFGPKTKKAVRAYQTARSLPVTGIVDDLTWWSPAGAAGATLASRSGLVTA